MNVKKATEFILKVKEIIFAVSVIVVAALNLWLGSKLAPLSQDIATIRNQVLANERNIESIGNYADQIKEDVILEVKENRQRIDNIYNLLSR